MVRRRNGKFWFSMVSCLLAFSAANASADNKGVAKRLKTYADLSESDARTVIDKVSQRMKVAADVANTRDPLRVAVSQALYDSASPANESELSMVRLRLYAGLTQWALENLFASRSTVTRICSGQSELDAEDCRALLAAGQSVPLDDISPLRLNPNPQPDAAVAVAAPPVARSNYTPPPAAPVARVQAPVRSAPVAAGSSASVSARKAEYARQRADYLERRRQEMEARKAKVMATAGGERARRGPASQEEAEVVGLARSSAHDSGSPALVASRSSGAAARSSKPSGEDSDLLEGLMDDPLGKSE